jgi:hypothetical protein
MFEISKEIEDRVSDRVHLMSLCISLSPHVIIDFKNSCSKYFEQASDMHHIVCCAKPPFNSSYK